MNNAETEFRFLIQDPQLPPPTSVPGAGNGGGPAAQEGTTSAPGGQTSAPPSPGGLGGMLLPFAILILFMWFFVMRPERKRQKTRAAMLAAVQKGDKVVTAGGLHGTIVAMDERTITLRVDEKVRMKFDRSAVGRLASAPEDASAAGANRALTGAK